MSGVVFVYSCDDCETEIEADSIFDVDNSPPRIDLNSIGNMSFECPNCGAEYGTSSEVVFQFSEGEVPEDDGNED